MWGEGSCGLKQHMWDMTKNPIIPLVIIKPCKIQVLVTNNCYSLEQHISWQLCNLNKRKSKYNWVNFDLRYIVFIFCVNKSYILSLIYIYIYICYPLLWDEVPNLERMWMHEKEKKNTSSNALIFLITWELRDEAFESYIFMLKTFQLNYNTLHTWKNLSTPKKKKKY